MTEQLICSDHARCRMAQRGISLADIGYVVTHGFDVENGRDEAVVLRRTDIPPEDQRSFGHLAGTKVVLHGGLVKTTYRNRSRWS